jgi:hypothetical protein
MFGSIVAGRAAVDNGANACVHILKPVTVTVEDADDLVREAGGGVPRLRRVNRQPMTSPELL